TTPPPSTRVFMASHVEEIARTHGVVGVEKDLAEAGEICAAGDLGQDGRPPLHLRLAADAGGEAQAEKALADEGGAHPQAAAMMVEPTAMTPRGWKRARRAHVPDRHGAASTWPGPHTSALRETPAASGSSWTRILSTLVLPAPGISTWSWALTACRTAIPRSAIRRASSRLTDRPRCDASTMANTFPTPTATSTGTSPTPSTSTAWAGRATKDGVQRSVTSRTRSPSERATVSTTPASVSMTME